MGNISDLLPQESATVQAIYDWHKKNGDAEKRREYLGASAIGDPCERALWYGFRFAIAKTFDGRLYRLFMTGHLEEPRMVDELQGIGCEVHAVDEDGQQFGFKAVGGHMAGHMDGSALGVLEAPKTWHVLECKTHKASEYAKLVKANSIKESHPKHYAQAQFYMGVSGMTRCLYLAKNKDTDHLHSERIRFNADDFKAIMEKAERIIRAPQPPARCATRPDTFACKFCDAYKLCWGTGSVAVPLPDKTCRTCCHATPEIDKGENWGRWSCSSKGCDLSFDDQLAGCDNHLLIPDLVSFAKPTDSGDTWIEFTNTGDGAVWIHGNGESGSWRTEELLITPGPIVGNSAVAKLKEAFKGSITGFEDGTKLTLIEKYPPEDCEKLWDGEWEDEIIKAALLEFVFGDSGEDIPDPTDQFEDDAHIAAEFYGQVCLVIYKDHNHAAIWRGKE